MCKNKQAASKLAGGDKYMRKTSDIGAKKAQDDFMEDPPKKFYRLAPGREVRLRAACYITCQEAVKDADGNVIELRCTWDPESRGGTTPDKRKVRSTMHWVSTKHAVEAEVRL